MFADWSLYSAFHIPLMLKNSCPKGSLRDPEKSRPFRDGERYPVVVDHRGPSLMKSLLSKRNPSAVLWKVSKVVINSIQGISFGLLSHVFQKGFKGVPSFAYRYASIMICFPFVLLGCINAATSHTHPGLVGRGLRSSMSYGCPKEPLPPQAPTTLGMPIPEIILENLSTLSTRTLTQDLTPWEPLKGFKSAIKTIKIYHELHYTIEDGIMSTGG